MTFKSGEYPGVLKDLKKHEKGQIEENIKLLVSIMDGNGLLTLLKTEEVKPKLILEKMLILMKETDFSEEKLAEFFRRLIVNLERRPEWGKHFDKDRKQEILKFFREDIKELLDFSPESYLSSSINDVFQRLVSRFEV